MAEPNNSSAIEVLENLLIRNKSDCSSPINNSHSTQESFSETVQSTELISPATAVPISGVCPLSDDDDPKVILNLEMAIPQKDRKANDSQMNSSIDAEDTNEPATNLSEIARMQLAQLTVKKRGRAKRVSKELESGSNDANIGEQNTVSNSEKVRESSAVSLNKIMQKKSSRSLTSPIISKKELEKEILERLSVPVSLEEEITSITITRSEANKEEMTHKEAGVKNDDLIAILEGKDENASITVEVVGREGSEVFEVIPIVENGEETESPTADIIKETEKKIALEQMLSIPTNRKRNKRTDGSAKNLEPIVKVEPSTDLLSSLVSDWSDTEKEVESKTSKYKKISNPAKSAVTNESVSNKKEELITQSRGTRIIKKKIIWDPDAPETQFSFASLVQSSAKKHATKKSRLNTPKKIENIEPEDGKEQIVQKPKILNMLKRRSETPPTLNNKKKKSEIDKLLADEGAANMLNSLENEKNFHKESRTKKDATPSNTVRREGTPKKKLAKTNPASASSSWDYVYNQQNVDSMIIRRRSNSSYSSTTSPRRLSLDHVPNKQDSKNGKFEFARPEMKKCKKNEDDELINTIATDIKRLETRESVRKSNRTPVHIEKEQLVNQTALQEKSFAELVQKKHGNVVQLIFKSKSDKIKNSFTQTLMDEVVRRLEILREDIGCKVVVVTHAGTQFCQGVDFTPLTFGTAEKRKAAANELATTVRNFLYAIASFPKPVIAGISGSCSGIGVTLLPLFDLVVASDKSIFEIPSAKIGQIVEGNCIMSLTNNVRHNFKTRMFWLCEQINSTEAVFAGLITKSTVASKVQDDTLQLAKQIALLSQQTFAMMKSLRQKNKLKELTDALNEEQKILVKQWLSPECQQKFKEYITKEQW